nr:hypothetical protein [uncultured Alistipes sp.]
MKSQRGTNDANGLPESYPAARSVSDGIRGNSPVWKYCERNENRSGGK